MGGVDGSEPSGALTNVGGALRGTTYYGGGTGCLSSGCGTVFTITASGTESVLHSFGSGSDGQNPAAGLIDVGSALYGTTFYGGTEGLGAVFKITTSGEESVLYSFGSGSDGQNPAAGLIDVGGTLFGTTYFGGSFANDAGAVFKITTSGTERLIHRFGNHRSDGSYPDASLLNLNGTVYGTTYAGGAPGNGTVYTLTTINKSAKESVLYSFMGGSDGANPRAGLLNVGGTLYGTTTNGGSSNLGTVFEIAMSGKERVLHSFASGSDGANPHAGLVDVGGALYGTTANGGSSGLGTIFKITTSGEERILHSFGSGSDGANPSARLLNVGGTLYGTTYRGGGTSCSGGGCGTVFSIRL
jgi:uncharacterized repeat protein (TIGR03803 family)